MRLVRFNENGKSLWINPSHVVGVHESNRMKDMTDICTVKWIFTVEESVDEVVNKLDIWLS